MLNYTWMQAKHYLPLSGSIEFFLVPLWSGADPFPPFATAAGDHLMIGSMWQLFSPCDRPSNQQLGSESHTHRISSSITYHLALSWERFAKLLRSKVTIYMHVYVFNLSDTLL